MSKPGNGVPIKASKNKKHTEECGKNHAITCVDNTLNKRK